MGARHGHEFLQGLRDEREVWLGSKRIDVAEHPAFAGSRAGLAGYFEWQHQHADQCLMRDPESVGRTLGLNHTLAQREQTWTAVPEFLQRSKA